MAVVGPLKAKIGAWAAFSSHGTLPIELYQGTMNMVRLKAVFKKNLIRPAAAQFSGQPIRLLQDNAKYHTGHAIHQWLFNNGVDEVKIPTYSPDLNPMENMFSILKHNIEARNPKNIETLQEIAKDEWAKSVKLSVENWPVVCLIESDVSSHVTVVEQVIDKKRTAVYLSWFNRKNQNKDFYPWL